LAEEAFDIPLALVIAVVVEAEFLSTEGGGLAEGAIILAMGTGRVGHEASK
jgi:hypothetical protein